MNITGKTETAAEILKHPANDSTAKYHWSFSKAPRFKSCKSYTNTISYDLPSTISRRKSGFGHGNRLNFFDSQKVKNPSPTQYKTISVFENKKEGKGYSFGQFKDLVVFGNYLNQVQHTPGAYDLCQNQTNPSRAYSLRPKTAYPKNYFLPNKRAAESLQKQPGPGKYETIDMIGSGKNFFNSKFKTQKQKSFHGSERFSKGNQKDILEKTTPGPSDYNVSLVMEPDGICFLSTMKSHGRRAILNEKRQLRLDGNKETPGPGVYKKPSDFGHYDRPNKAIRPQTARA